VFLGTFTYDCTPNLTPEQRGWPVVECESTDVFLGTFTYDCTPNLTPEQRTEPTTDGESPSSHTEPEQSPPRQPPPPSRP
jgi:hypothetical protein